MEDTKKTHWDKYKKHYLYSGTLLLLTTTFAVGHRLGSSDSVSRNVNGLININADPIQNNILVQLERRGHPGNKILCNQTGEVFASQMRAAKANGVSPSSLSEHLRGLKDNVNGFTFEKLGEMV